MKYTEKTVLEKLNNELSGLSLNVSNTDEIKKLEEKLSIILNLCQVYKSFEIFDNNIDKIFNPKDEKPKN